MNIIETLIARIEDYRLENKNPCKNYATKENAEKATSQMAKECGEYFAKDKSHAYPAHYVVFYVPAWGRWVGAINITEMVNRPSSTGGYLGFCTGFYTW